MANDALQSFGEMTCPNDQSVAKWCVFAFDVSSWDCENRLY